MMLHRLLETTVLLDPSIRDWVLFPLTFVSFLVIIFRDQVTEVMKKSPERELNSLRENQALARSGRFRTYAHVLPAQSILMRKAYFTDSENGPVGSRADPESRPSLGDAMAGLTGSQGLVAVLRNMEQLILMAWINYFWSGFVLVRLPFGLTQRFRQLTQRGIELSTLDVRYVSSLSWYFICVFGLRGIMSFLLGAGETPAPFDSAQLAPLFGAATALPLVANAAQPLDVGKRFHSEKEFLQILPATSIVGKGHVHLKTD